MQMTDYKGLMGRKENSALRSGRGATRMSRCSGPAKSHTAAVLTRQRTVNGTHCRSYAGKRDCTSKTAKKRILNLLQRAKVEIVASNPVSLRIGETERVSVSPTGNEKRPGSLKFNSKVGNRKEVCCNTTAIKPSKKKKAGVDEYIALASNGRAEPMMGQGRLSVTMVWCGRTLQVPGWTAICC